MSKLQTLVHTLKMKAVLPRQRVRIGLFTVLDNKCQFEHHIHIDRFCTLHHTSIGAYSYISYYSSASDCTIGKFCSIGTGVYIGLPIHPLDRVSTSPTFYAANKTGKCFYVDTTVEESRHTTVGNDVWIGSNALIMGGVNIGHGAVIAAAAVVTKDVPPYAVVAGLPAKIISYRYDDETIAAFLKMKWWDLDDRVLEKLAPSFKNAGNLISEFDSFVSQGGGDQDADTSY